MSTINVVVAANILDEYVRRIKETDPKIRLKAVGPLLRTERQVQELIQKGEKPSPEQQRALDELEDTMTEAEVLYMPQVRLVGRNLGQRCPKVKWVQFLSAGSELVNAPIGLRPDVIITTAKGCNASPVAEHAISLMLALAKHTRRAVENQAEHRWDRFVSDELAGNTVGIVGLGGVGTAIARLAKAFQMRVLATRRSATGREGPNDLVDRMYAPSQLNELIPLCDYLTLAAPLTPETTNLIGERELHAMKPSAYLVNVSRGKVVDQTALIRALNENWIAGAAVDVTEPEPLPEQHPLWSAPNLIITAHVAGNTHATGSRMAQLFCDNLKRYLAGGEMINVLDRSKGY